MIEPYPPLRECLVDLLHSHGMTAMAMAADRASALNAVKSWRPTVALVDPHQQLGHEQRGDPGGLIAALHAADPTLPVVMHTAMFAPGTLPRPERFHAVAVIPKGSAPDELIAAIRHAHRHKHTAHAS